MNRALLGKMTFTRFSFGLSGCFVILLIWGCTTVVCLVNEDVTVQPVTVTDASGGTTQSIACESSERCWAFCHFCGTKYGGPSMDCLSTLFLHLCQSHFENAMTTLNNTDWCIWGNVNSLYSNLSICTEEISDCLLIPWPNPLVEQFFVDIHSRFFKECPTEEFSDPPPPIVFALVFIPICLIPVMVSLVVLKTKNGDGSS
ncbi:receptor activity-modifying protein 2 [Leuresthes tenuis]|uniref:receptor activity-modifying protein 2 n=1 Tax=Leuresthes tenuis TaxID=355514 RepID=UPI003B50AE96